MITIRLTTLLASKLTGARHPRSECVATPPDGGVYWTALTVLTRLTALTADRIDRIDVVDGEGRLAAHPMMSTSSTMSAVNPVNAVNKVNAVKNPASAIGGRSNPQVPCTRGSALPGRLKAACI
ncbi:MAG: hypothetical protein ACK42H_19870 [Planctomycetota bacterium]